MAGSVAGLVLSGVGVVPGAADPSQPAASVASLPASTLLARYAGDWERIADERAESERLANIDVAVSDLSWMTRKVVTGVLRRSAAPPPAVHFDWNGRALSQRLEVDGKRLERPIRLVESTSVDAMLGAAAREDAEANPESLWRWRDDGRLQVFWFRDQARGATTFALGEDGSLHVLYEIHVTAIEGVAPIRYVSSFARRSSPDVAAGPSDPTSESLPVSAHP